MFCNLLKCFDDKFGDICTEFGNESKKNRTETDISTLNTKLAEQNVSLNFAHQECYGFAVSVA